MLIFTVSMFGLSVYLPKEWLWIMVMNSIIFVIGRTLFFVGYHIKGIYRGPGFTLGLWTSIASILYCCVVVAMKYWLVASIVFGVVLLFCAIGCCIGSNNEKDDNYEEV